MKNKLSVAFYTLLFSICASLFSYNEITAQENGIYELNESKMVSKESSKKDKKSNRENFYNLAFKLHPTSYIENNNVKNRNSDALTISKLTFNDAKSFNVLNNGNSRLNDVELITITLRTVEDLNNKLDLTERNNLSNLKYVYIKCFFNCSEEQIKKFISSDSNIRVFYKTEIPS